MWDVRCDHYHYHIHCRRLRGWRQELTPPGITGGADMGLLE